MLENHDVLLALPAAHAPVLVDLATVPNYPHFLVFLIGLMLPGELTHLPPRQQQAPAVPHIAQVYPSLDDQAHDCAGAASLDGEAFLAVAYEFLLHFLESLLQCQLWLSCEVSVYAQKFVKILLQKLRTF
jgi:hypothetical protein